MPKVLPARAKSLPCSLLRKLCTSTPVGFFPFPPSTQPINANAASNELRQLREKDGKIVKSEFIELIPSGINFIPLGVNSKN